MEDNLNKIKDFVLDLEYSIVSEDQAEGIVVVENQDAGITNLILDVEDPVLVVELHLFDLKNGNEEIYKNFLKMNREIIHGAIALDDSGEKVIFRDTLQIENLDLNELQGTFNSLELFLSEYASELIKISKN